MENISTDSQIHGYSLGLRKILLFSARCILLFSLTIQSAVAQELSTTNKKAKKLYLKADKSYKERDFYSAIAYLEQASQEDKNFYEAYLRMGSLYTATAQTDSAFSKFQDYVIYSTDPMVSVLEKLAQGAFDRGQYSASREYVTRFLLKVPERANSSEIKLLLRSLDFAENQLNAKSDSIVVKELPKAINRYRLQYLPSVTIDTSSIFFTKRDHVSGDEDIVVSFFKDGQWQPAKSVSSRINSKLNEGACSVSANGRTMIFTSCEGKNGLGSCDLYISKKIGDEWSYPKNLGKGVNSIYWESQPSLSADGKTLFFSSNRRGGYGGRDIWVSKEIDGKWTSPVNLGSVINSSRDETTPFIHPNGVSIFFSANGYPGMGGYDLFVSEKVDSEWSVPQNLGYPINTFRDEVSIVLSGDGVSAYFAKEKKKGYTIEDSKIVKTTLPSSVKQKGVTYIRGKIVDASTREPLSAFVEVVDLENSSSIYNSKSDSISGSYYMVLPKGLELAAYVKKKGYLFADYHFSTKGSVLKEPDTVLIELQKVEAGKRIVLENIYFETASYKLNEKSSSDLKSALILLRDNPSIVVEIAGHTDNVGDEEYNKKLSTQRAEEVRKRLIEMGIESRRLEYKGYAASQPLQTNLTEEGKQSNRRIEFRVLRMK
ncbi:MAG: PD40 domain-containing protein [Ekhidna sp.]|nr:PD40 domain-containing protein [Ekhidna sp.]